jgi:hypothetical protein
VDEVRYYLKVSDNQRRSNPKAIMRRYSEGGVAHDEAFRFNGQGWTATDFFAKHRLGHNEDDFIEVSEDEAEFAIAEKFRLKEEREAGGER